MNEAQEKILKDMVWSYSSVGAYKQCPLSFQFMYLYKIQRANNIFAESGSAAHDVMEKIFSKEIEVFEAEHAFLEAYKKFVTCSPPPQLGQRYEENTIQKMRLFFSNLDIDVDDYEVLCMEDKYNYEVEDIKIVIKPDLIVRRKSDGKILLWDYKTSLYKKESHEGYAKQCSLYKRIYEEVTGNKIDEMSILYFKETSKVRKTKEKDGYVVYGRFIDLEYIPEVLETFVEDVKKIRNESVWDANLDEFYCQSLCSARKVCDFKEKHFGF